MIFLRANKTNLRSLRRLMRTNKDLRVSFTFKENTNLCKKSFPHRSIIDHHFIMDLCKWTIQTSFSYCPTRKMKENPTL